MTHLRSVQTSCLPKSGENARPDFPAPKSSVILRGVDVSRSEAFKQSKDPCLIRLTLHREALKLRQ
jgi:hypothetical protein